MPKTPNDSTLEEMLIHFPLRDELQYKSRGPLAGVSLLGKTFFY